MKIPWRLVTFVGALSVSATAVADVRHTTEAVVLRKKPGEREPAVTNIPANAEITVLSEQGRWVRVRYGSAEGYITRTTIDEPVPQVTPTAGWSAARHPNETGEVTDLFVQTTVPSRLFASPSTGAAPIAELASGTKLSIVDAASTPGWVHARDDGGHDGWIARAEVSDTGSGVTVDANSIHTANVGAPFVRAPERAHGELGVGYRSLGMNMTANQVNGLTNYLAASDAMAAVGTVEVLWTITGRIYVGADARVEVSQSSPGLDYPGPTNMPGKIPFDTFAADVGGQVGIHVNELVNVALHLGGHYDAFLPDDVNNVGMLPRESLAGATVGLRAALVPPHSRFAATARFDVLAIGSRSQTPGLQDGTDSRAHAVWGGATLSYLIGRRIAMFAGFDLGWASTHWDGPSAREPGVTNAHRVDTSQLVQLGVSAAL